MTLWPPRDWHFVAKLPGGRPEAKKVQADADPAVFTDLSTELHEDEGEVQLAGRLRATSFGEVEQCLEGIGVTHVEWVEAE